MSVPMSPENPPTPPTTTTPAGSVASGGPDAAARFRRLARSSPWRWRALRFHYILRAGGASSIALVRRPDGLRVSTPDGDLIFASPHAAADHGSAAAKRSSWLMSPHLVTPLRHADGLVQRRPQAAYGEPWYDDPRLASALDPVQLAGNAPAAAETPHAEPVIVHAVRDVNHEGRPAMEALVSPGHAYRVADPAAALLGPGRSTVRLDLGTGVCVLVQPEDQDGGHLWLRILTVDEYVSDDEFIDAGSPA